MIRTPRESKQHTDTPLISIVTHFRHNRGGFFCRATPLASLCCPSFMKGRWNEQKQRKEVNGAERRQVACGRAKEACQSPQRDAENTEMLWGRVESGKSCSDEEEMWRRKVKCSRELKDGQNRSMKEWQIRDLKQQNKLRWKVLLRDRLLSKCMRSSKKTQTCHLF